MPLEYAYSEIPLAQTIEKLVDEGKAPVYVVHFTQEDAADSAQDFTSLKICTREEKDAVGARDRRLPLHEPLRRRRPQVAPARHRPPPRGAAAEVPRARRAARAARAAEGHLRHRHARRRHQRADPHACCSRGSASSTARRRRVLSARDFHQIAGRAGRKGFDDRGCVVAQAPEHVIENLRLEREGEGRQEGRQAQAARAQLRELGPEDLQAADRRAARAAGLALPGLARDAAERARAAAATAAARCSGSIRDSHETGPREEGALRARRGSCSARSSTRGIVEFVPRTAEGAQAAGQRRPAGRLLDGPGAVAVPARDDPAARPRVARPTRSTCSRWSSRSSRTRSSILRRQLDQLKDRAVAEMKADGIEYDQRMEELEKLEYPKPLRDFVYDDLQRVRRSAPVGRRGEHPARSRSRARCSRASARSPTTCTSTSSSAPRGCCCGTSTASTRCSARPCPTARRPTRCARWSCTCATCCAGRLEPARRVGADARPELPAARAGADAELRPPRPEEPPGHHARHEGVHRGDPHAHLHVPARVVDRDDEAALGAARRRRPTASRRAVDGRAAAGGARGLPRRARRPAPRPRGAQPAAHARRARRTTAHAGACSRCWSIPRA